MMFKVEKLGSLKKVFCFKNIYLRICHPFLLLHLLAWKVSLIKWYGPPSSLMLNPSLMSHQLNKPFENTNPIMVCCELS